MLIKALVKRQRRRSSELWGLFRLRYCFSDRALSESCGVAAGQW